MNLADAIRQAAVSGGVPEPTRKEVVAQPVPEPEVVQVVNEDQEGRSVGQGSGTVVRLELFLSPEQLTNLFRSVTAGQHSMMTLREASAYLRVSSGALETMAQEGLIPAISLDGRWRFPRPALDEWLTSQAYGKDTA